MSPAAQVRPDLDPAACAAAAVRDDPTPMQRTFLGLAVTAALGWQATAALRVEWDRLVTEAARPWSLRLTADTATRWRQALGEDADLLLAMRAAVAPGSIAVLQQVMGDIKQVTPEQFAQLNARNGLIDQMVTLLYPDPWVIAWSDPMALVEDLVGKGRDTTLVVLDGDREPVDRPGWSLAVTAPRFRTWRFQKG